MFEERMTEIDAQVTYPGADLTEDDLAAMSEEELQALPGVVAATREGGHWRLRAAELHTVVPSLLALLNARGAPLTELRTLSCDGLKQPALDGERICFSHVAVGHPATRHGAEIGEIDPDQGRQVRAGQGRRGQRLAGRPGLRGRSND